MAVKDLKVVSSNRKQILPVLENTILTDKTSFQNGIGTSTGVCRFLPILLSYKESRLNQNSNFRSYIYSFFFKDNDY